MQNISMHTRIIFANQCRKNQFDSLSYKKNMLRAIPDMARVFWSRIFVGGIYGNYFRRKFYNPFMDARVSVRVARCRRPAGPRDFRPARPRPTDSAPAGPVRPTDSDRPAASESHVRRGPRAPQLEISQG